MLPRGRKELNLSRSCKVRGDWGVGGGNPGLSGKTKILKLSNPKL